VVAAEGDQRLRAGDPLHGQHGRERRRHRGQRLGRGDGGDGGLAVGGGAHAGVAAQQTPSIQAGLGLLDRHVVGQGAPPALGCGVVGLLHHALAVPAPRRADRHRHPVVLGDRGERGGDPAAARVTDGGHPVEPPGAGQPTQPDADPVQRVDQVRLIGRLGQHPAPPPGVCQRSDQQQRLRPPAPLRGWVGQLQPVELSLLTRRVLDHRYRPTAGRAARFARRTQPTGTNLAGERRIRAVVTQLEQLVEQRGRPQVRVLAQPFPAVAGERLERIGLGPAALAGDPVAAQVGADGLAVMAQVPGDRRDRPAPAMQRVRVHIVLPCDHETWRSLRTAGGQRPAASKGPPPSRRSHAGGEVQ
jgi:hypothetical protein